MSALSRRSAPSRGRRLAGAGLGVAALTLGGLTAFHVPSSGADTNRPTTFSGGAAAAAVHEEENGQAGFAVYEPFYGSFAEGSTRYSNDGQLARASTFWPGPTFGNTGSLICQLNCEPVPTFPLSVQTEGPPSQPPNVSQQTSTQAGGAGQPSSLNAAAADASADPDAGVATDAVTGAFSAPGESATAAGAPASSSSASSPSPLPGPASASSGGDRLATASAAFFRQASLILRHPVSASAAASSAVVAVKSMTASTAQHFSGSTLLSDAQTQLSGVSLLGGMIDIASVHTESHAKTDGAGVHTHNDVVTVSGVTVAGQPATIGSNGVTVSGQGSGSALLDSLNAALQQALEAANADVTLVGATAKPPQPLVGDCTGAQADGVFVHTSANAQAAPLVGDIYNGDYTLGSSCASVSATPAGSSLPAPPAGLLPGSTTSPASGGAVDTGTAALPVDAGSLGGSGATAGGGGESTGSSATPGASGGSPRQLATTSGAFVSRRFSTLYLSVVLALAAVLVGLGFHRPRPSVRGVGRRSGQ
ncbi:MAG TPA: hypothetical protein VFW24_16015 [Acidimicrobiales bacterium]|nr:hypothetical protein [Acidimicrobiales bacterium]